MIYDGGNHYLCNISFRISVWYVMYICIFVLFMCRTPVPFRATQHISNSWNENKKVQYSKDGQVRFFMNLLKVIIV